MSERHGHTDNTWLRCTAQARAVQAGAVQARAVQARAVQAGAVQARAVQAHKVYTDRHMAHGTGKRHLYT